MYTRLRQFEVMPSRPLAFAQAPQNKKTSFNQETTMQNTACEKETSLIRTLYTWSKPHTN